VFLTSSLMGAVPVISLREVELRHDSALCDRINEAVFEEVERLEPSRVRLLGELRAGAPVPLAHAAGSSR
jgi:hypothetical protein